MKYKNLLVLLVSVLALVLTVQSVSAFGKITHVEVNGINADSGKIDFAGFTKQKVPILVQFDATNFAEDVRLIAWVSGDRRNSVESERFDVIANKTYSRVVFIDLPRNLKDINEPRKLEITVESDKKGKADGRTIDLTVQRESYNIEILSVNMMPEVKAGESLFIDVVIKNRGSHFSDDTYLGMSIPELQLETKSYFGDLSPIDQSDPDKEDAVERRVYLRIPSSAKTGLYTVKLSAFNSDSITETEKRVFIAGIEKETRTIPTITSKTFSFGEEQEYRITLVNKGNTVQIYDLEINAPKQLNVEASDPVVVIPAGSSKTVTLLASSEEEGSYDFNVNVRGEDGTLISENSFRAKVEGQAKTVATNATVLLTVILAIVFVVLLVVLIVLLTRKPEQKEEFGESYY